MRGPFLALLSAVAPSATEGHLHRYRARFGDASTTSLLTSMPPHTARFTLHHLSGSLREFELHGDLTDPSQPPANLAHLADHLAPPHAPFVPSTHSSVAITPHPTSRRPQHLSRSISLRRNTSQSPQPLRDELRPPYLRLRGHLAVPLRSASPCSSGLPHCLLSSQSCCQDALPTAKMHGMMFRVICSLPTRLSSSEESG